MSTQLGQIAKKAKLDRNAQFTSLAHLLTPAFLKETWRMMNRKAASGVDGESTEQFASEMEERVEEICRQLKAGVYRAPPVRRVAILVGRVFALEHDKCHLDPPASTGRRAEWAACYHEVLLSRGTSASRTSVYLR